MRRHCLGAANSSNDYHAAWNEPDCEYDASSDYSAETREKYTTTHYDECRDDSK